MMADQLTVGSLCTGYGGLDLALKAHFNTRVIWTSEIDKHASRVVKARYRAPNLGDLKLIDWEAIEAPDIITAGYPCQPFSYAGGRNGTQDPRHIWPWIAEGIRHLRPRLAVMENVPGHLTKGFGEVIGTLAEMGYDATWGCVRASDAGAPHRRERVFIVATDADGAGRQGRGRPVAAADGERRSLTYCRGNPTLIGALKLLPTPRASDGADATSHHRTWSSTDYNMHNVARQVVKDGVVSGRKGPVPAEAATIWGEYLPAIERWEVVTGRKAPSPVLDTRLNPVFVEWMMGLRLGHVTAVGLARTQELKILGNGVVWQQAALALTHLLPIALTHSRQRAST